MFESLVETVKAFSFQSILKGNILSSPGSFGNQSGSLNGAKSNSPASNMTSNRFLSTYYNKMQEMRDYEISDLTDIIVGIYMDFLSSYINKEGQLISIDNSVENFEGIQKDLNDIFNSLDIINEVKDHLWDIIYNGSWSFRIDWNPNTRVYDKSYLYNPHNVVTIKTKGKITSHLVVTKKGTVVEIKPEYIVRLGKADLELINDINPEFFGTEKDDTIVKDQYLSGGTPLYYNISQKVKEYLLRDQILSLLSIKDLIQPLLLLIRLDKNTPIDEGNKLALNVENMINKYSDISSILSANFSINSLIDSLMNNIRVIPDYAGGVGDMNNIDLSKITSKIQEIESSQDNKKDSIMNAKAIPRALYNGEATKWDTLKSSERLRTAVNRLAIGITDSIKLTAIQIYYDKTGKYLDKDLIKVNLFKKTEVDYTQMITNLEIVSQLTQGIQGVLTSIQQTITDVKVIDPEQYTDYIYQQLKDIDPTISNFMNEEVIKNAISQLEQQQTQ